MIIHNVAQGSAEWLALRADFWTASEAPAMLGQSKQMKRSELLFAKKTGLDREISWWVQTFLFDKGHEFEALARPIVEDSIGEELYPIVGSNDKMLASMDGATMLGETLYEHKMWNEELAAQIHAGELDPHYYWQLEQQLLVSGAERVIFVCSDGTAENFAQLEYRPVAGRKETLIQGWKQFEADLANYVPQEKVVEAIGAAPDQLPALRIDVTGMVTASNLDAFKAHALTVIGNINTNLKDDKDFADADATVKWCGEVEDKLKAAKEHALSQTESIDILFKAIDDIAAETRRKRLELEKLVKARKENIRTEIVMDAAKSLQAHIDQIDATLGGRIRMPKVPANFAEAIKGKKSVSSLREAADAELARAKIEASRIADGIRINQASLNELAVNHKFLFHDAQELVMKANDDLVALIKVRISEHDQQQAELKRLEEENAQLLAAQQQQVVEPVVQQQTVTPIVESAPVTTTPIKAAETAAPAADDGQRFKLGDLSDRLGFTVSADFLRSLGFEVVANERGASLYREVDFPRICAALISHIQKVQNIRAAA
ncbi:YqaJ viral recombinase family protein [Pseudomonas fluorescens]|uniref:YqaJ viral recombinase family protein n=1 Tax=Pseudomonas fluorescens TaxID=294 RepID=UPI001CA6499C|nr:YqaJ viral recombinase family protein [Pseudomonas fluorescens]MBY8934246.1 YqaJ viral recombinase family protein [Pseudomonas fluorescens]